MDSNILYRELILEHSQHPKNFGSIKNPTISAEDSNRTCGDTIHLDFLIEKNTIKNVKFSGVGCAISRASASILTDMIKSKKVSDAVKISKDDLLKELGIPLSPARLKCSLLALKVAKVALYGLTKKTTAALKEEFDF